MHQTTPLRLATRRSPLARWQADWVAKELRLAGHSVELVLLTSRGDEDQRPIEATQSVGLFTRRIQQALLEEEADIAVHSLKDLPTDPHDQLQLAAIPPRAPVADCLIARDGLTLATLPAGTVVGTGSRRRAAQLRHQRPDITVAPIRGNVETRLGKVQDKQFDATILAEAGLIRLNKTMCIAERLSLEIMLPAPGQGALGIETRVDDPRTTALVAELDDPYTRFCVTAERTLLRTLSGGCLAPIAALAIIEENILSLTGVVLSLDGRTRLYQQAQGPVDQAVQLGETVANGLQQQGADTLIAAAR